jgi:hypothetical protein
MLSSLASSERVKCKEKESGFSWFSHHPYSTTPFIPPLVQSPNIYCSWFLGWNVGTYAVFLVFYASEDFRYWVIGLCSRFIFPFSWVYDICVFRDLDSLGKTTTVLKINGDWWGRQCHQSAPPLASTSWPTSINSVYSFLCIISIWNIWTRTPLLVTLRSL